MTEILSKDAFVRIKVKNARNAGFAEQDLGYVHSQAESFFDNRGFGGPDGPEVATSPVGLPMKRDIEPQTDVVVKE